MASLDTELASPQQLPQDLIQIFTGANEFKNSTREACQRVAFGYLVRQGRARELHLKLLINLDKL